MKLEAYKDYVTSRCMRIHSRISDKDYDILISDGHSRVADEDHDAPHYKTMYAFSRGDEVFLGEFFTTPSSIIGMTDKDIRMKECEKRAREQLINFKEAGCLK